LFNDGEILSLADDKDEYARLLDEANEDDLPMDTTAFGDLDAVEDLDDGISFIEEDGDARYAFPNELVDDTGGKYSRSHISRADAVLEHARNAKNISGRGHGNNIGRDPGLKYLPDSAFSGEPPACALQPSFQSASIPSVRGSKVSRNYLGSSDSVNLSLKYGWNSVRHPVGHSVYHRC
jgi:hypothetical protein